MPQFPSRVLALALAAVLAMAPARAQLPTLGDSGELTSIAERKLGERVARELYRDPDYIDDPVLVEYVQSLWQPLLAAARARGDLSNELQERFAWQVLLGKDRTINAFAVPGGWLGVHLGLIATTTTRDELASVLSHELSHVTQRHISRMMAQEKKNAPLLLAALILGAIAAGKSPEAGNAVMAGTQALAIQSQLNYSRDMESEADRIGFGVLTQAGFDPQGFVTMFEKLQQASRLNDTGQFPYLRTHPMTTDRVAEMQSRQQLVERSATPKAPSLEHAMVAARARVVSNPGVDALRGFVADANSPGLASQPPARQAAVLYAAILADAKLRDHQAARLMPRLQQLTAGEPRAARLAKLLDAEIALGAGDLQRTLRDVDPYSSSRPDLLLTQQVYVLQGRSGEAVDRLQTWVANNPRDAAAWQLLSRAYAAQGQPLRSIRAEAESRVAELDYSAALDRFKAAQDVARRGGAGADHIEASIIDSRARAVESLLREQALER